MAHELGFWYTSCECDRPGLIHDNQLAWPRWKSLEISFEDMTDEQRNYIQVLNEAQSARSGYGGPIKKDIEINFPEEVWTLQGCYFLNLEEDRMVVQFDRALVRY